MSRDLDSTMSMLHQLTENLPPVPNAQMRYDSTRASGTGFGIINSPELCIQRAFLFEGLKLYSHAHDGREWLIVIDGACTVRWGEEEQECKKGDYVVVEAGVEHSVEATDDTLVLLITVPGDQEGYPDGST